MMTTTKAINNCLTIGYKKVSHVWVNREFPNDDNPIVVFHPDSILCFRLKRGNFIKERDDGTELNDILRTVHCFIASAETKGNKEKEDLLKSVMDCIDLASRKLGEYQRKFGEIRYFGEREE